MGTTAAGMLGAGRRPLHSCCRGQQQSLLHIPRCPNMVERPAEIFFLHWKIDQNLVGGYRGNRHVREIDGGSPSSSESLSDSERPANSCSAEVKGQSCRGSKSILTSSVGDWFWGEASVSVPFCWSGRMASWEYDHAPPPPWQIEVITYNDKHFQTLKNDKSLNIPLEPPSGPLGGQSELWLSWYQWAGSERAGH